MSDLPRELSFKDLLKEAIYQGDCGSCYALTTIEMLEARLKKNYAKDIRLSIQYVLDCDYYNQGCDGGYPFLVSKFASEFEVKRLDSCPL